MAKANRTGTTGLNAGFANSGAGEARRLNQQALGRAGQAGQANYEFSTELGATGAAGTPNAGAGNARQANQRAMKNAGKAGKYGQ